jgi:hypothetical protein
MSRLASSIAVDICLMMELILLDLALYPNGSSDGVGLLYTGSCKRVRDLTTIATSPYKHHRHCFGHYIMQCLAATTRQEVHKAHAKGDSMNIGISSLCSAEYTLSG